MAAEALTNVAKHSRPDGSGLLGLQDRVAALGGRLRIESAPGNGTSVTATLRVRR